MMLVTLFAILALPAQGGATTGFVGPRQYFLVLGDSMGFGYQPNFDWSHGYGEQWFPELQTHGVQRLVNFSCLAETSATFINGNCAGWFAKHTPYKRSQLAVAVDFIKAHPGEVSPVTLDIGLVDELWSFYVDSCGVRPNVWEDQLAKMDRNLTQVILPQLVDALTNESGQRTGDLVLLNYPYAAQLRCPDDQHYAIEFNQHLADDAAQFNIPVADLYTAFNTGPDVEQKLCAYTWICARDNGHFTGGQPGEPGNGFGVVAQVLEDLLGY